MVCHNKAMENLTKERNIFFEKEQEGKDKIARLEVEKKNAEHDFGKTNQLFAQLRLPQHKQSTAVAPQLEDFYEPSKEMKEYQLVPES